MFFDGWDDLVRVAVLGAVGYLALIALLRITGTRTLAKMNMFDFIVTIALGSLLSAPMLYESVSLSEGIVGILVLVGLQFIIAQLSMRSDRIQRLVKGRPLLLFYKGQFLRDAMRRARIAEEEIRFVARLQGFNGLEDIGAVILETNGEFSVLSDASTDDGRLHNVDLPDEEG